MNALKCRTLAELHECVSTSSLDGERSFSRHIIFSELVTFIYKTSQIGEEILVMMLDKD